MSFEPSFSSRFTPRSWGAIFILSMGLIWAGAATAQATPTETDIDLAPFDGRWERVEVEGDEAARVDSIDHALDDLSWLVKKMASGVLRKTTMPPPEVQFIFVRGKLFERRITPHGEVVRRPVALDDTPRPEGEESIISWRAQDDALHLRWEQEQAYGSNVYRLADSGRQLIIEHTINVTAIKDVRPIIYQSRFARIPEAPPDTEMAGAVSAEPPR